MLSHLSYSSVLLHYAYDIKIQREKKRQWQERRKKTARQQSKLYLDVCVLHRVEQCHKARDDEKKTIIVSLEEGQTPDWIVGLTHVSHANEALSENDDDDHDDANLKSNNVR